MKQREIQVLEELAKSLSLLSTKGTVTATDLFSERQRLARTVCVCKGIYSETGE